MDSGLLAQPAIGPATSGRTRHSNGRCAVHFLVDGKEYRIN